MRVQIWILMGAQYWLHTHGVVPCVLSVSAISTGSGWSAELHWCSNPPRVQSIQVQALATDWFYNITFEVFLCTFLLVLVCLLQLMYVLSLFCLCPNIFPHQLILHPFSVPRQNRLSWLCHGRRHEELRAELATKVSSADDALKLQQLIDDAVRSGIDAVEIQPARF